MYTITLLRVTPTAVCYVWHNVHQQYFVTYGTMYTNSPLLRFKQWIPTALCYIWHNAHQQRFVAYDTMNTNSTLLRVIQWTPTALRYIRHNVHQQRFVTYGTMYTSAQEINFDLGSSCRSMKSKVICWLHVTDVLHLAALLVGLQTFLLRASSIHYTRQKYLLCSWIWI